MGTLYRAPFFEIPFSPAESHKYKLCGLFNAVFGLVRRLGHASAARLTACCKM
jgi:hypothetical protein